MASRLVLGFVLVLGASLISVPAAAQARRPQAPVQKISDGVYRVGPINVDTKKKEISVAGVINSNVTVLEFVANTRGGQKAYESAVTIDSDALMFNTALLLIGLDPSRARVPKRHFDPATPKGDPVEIWVESSGPSSKRVRIEQLLYDERSKTTFPEGPWVYTGSTFSDGHFLAESDGVLIGFVHSPSPMIENPRSAAVGAYGSIVLNNRIGLPGGTKVTITVRALPLTAR